MISFRIKANKKQRWLVKINITKMNQTKILMMSGMECVCVSKRRVLAISDLTDELRKKKIFLFLFTFTMLLSSNVGLSAQQINANLKAALDCATVNEQHTEKHSIK